MSLMLEESASDNSPIPRVVALLWIAISMAGCTERSPDASPEQQPVDAGVEHRESSRPPQTHDTKTRSQTSDVRALSNGCVTQQLAPGAHNLSLTHGGWERNYVVTVPESTDSEPRARPLLIAMHGFGGSGLGMRNAIGRHGGFEDRYVVLYPDGAGLTNNERGWNSGHPRCCGTALRNNVDDVGFLRELVGTVANETCIDLGRVYATGFSNGGDMAQRLACDASDLVAAVSSVAGRFDYHASACPGQRSVPAVLYRGKQDRTVPYSNTLGSLIAIKTIPAIEGFEQIARNHKCRGNPSRVLSLESTDCILINDCDDGFELALCSSAGAGHCWPGIGHCTQIDHDGAAEFSASHHMRKFFSRHRKPH